MAEIRFWKEMRQAAKSLSKDLDPNVERLGRELVAVLDFPGTAVKQESWVSLVKVAAELAEEVKSRKESTDRKIRDALTLQVNRDGQFLDDLVRFIKRLPKSNEDPGGQVAEEEDEPNHPRFKREAAVVEFMRAVRAQARARARNRKLPRSNRARRVVEWLGDRSLPERDLRDVGENLLVQSLLRRFVNFAQRYVNRIPVRYRRFRRIRQAEKRWYSSGKIEPTEIHPLEVDILLLTMFRSTEELITETRNLRNVGNPILSTLVRLQRQYRTQVLVDEATDFSPIQLSCMMALSRPETRSFFACGDFNQRLTNWGMRSIEQVRWAVPDIETRSISVAYRQSSQLHQLARQIIVLSNGSAAEGVLPDRIENNGLPPVLGEKLSDNSAIAAWLASRIQEIEVFVDELPSIAVLVNGEEEVDTVAKALTLALEDQNIHVVPCRDGRVRGRDSAVRVLNVKHIKGLEFEAVFFVGIDKVVANYPELFDKYLYVGATRAATYFGMSCEQALPSRLGELRRMFNQKWD